MIERHAITTDKIIQFLRRNGYDCMPTYNTRDVCHIVITREISISVINHVAEIMYTSRFDDSVRVSEPFYTMEDFVDYFLDLKVVQ